MQKFSVRRGKLTVKRRNDKSQTTLGNNACLAFMFNEIWYELNGVETDCNRNVGITSTIKNYVSLMYDKTLIMRNAGWDTTLIILEEPLIFMCRSTRYWVFARITNAWLLTLVTN